METKQTLVLDTECYPNYYLVQFKSVEKRTVRSYELYEGSSLNIREIVSILRHYRIVTFNGITYDMPLLFYALNGATNAELKKASDHIILGELRDWQFAQEYGIEVPDWLDHIDLKEPVPGVQISLKLYGGRLHSKKLQDLPYEPDTLIDEEKRNLLREYCVNDLDTTIDLWLKATDPKDNIIETRERLTAESGIDVRSKSDAQIAEAIIKKRVEHRMGQRIYRPEVRPGTTYKYQPPEFVRFTHPVLQAKFAEICAADFVVGGDGKTIMPPCLNNAKITIGKSTYSMGIGGLHSTEKSVGYVATPSLLLRDRDVASFYPSLILKCGLSPSSMSQHFQSIYKEFVDRRIYAKRNNEKSVAQTLKIFLNGTFGKLGSKWSVLYAPNLLLQVTITGQLVLLMLIERMEAAGIPVVSANTDGIVMACPATLERVMLDIVSQWERDTGMETEETRYRGLFLRDVNNYVALKEKGGVKTKGVFADTGFQKNPTNEIVNLAVCEYLDKGTPHAETILKCKDVRKFLSVKRVSGGAVWRGEYLGKVVRWYRSINSTSYIEYGKGAKLGHKVGGSDNAMPLMELPDELPGDIDYEFYIKEASDLLREIGAMK
jgi:hypothetical protein